MMNPMEPITRGLRAWRSADTRWKWQQIGKKPDFEIHVHVSCPMHGHCCRILNRSFCSSVQEVLPWDSTGIPYVSYQNA
jgi:hypothetical protein